MDPEVAAFFAPPNDVDRERIRTDLVSRARSVRRNGWDDYLYVWSSGEVAGTAYLLQDNATLRELNETEDSVLSRFAYDLYGIAGGAKERAADWAATRAWFTAARNELSLQ